MEKKNQEYIPGEPLYEDEPYEEEEENEEDSFQYLDWSDDQWSEDEFKEDRYTLIREKITFPPAFKPFIPDYSNTTETNWMSLSPTVISITNPENIQKIVLPKKNWNMNLLTTKNIPEILREVEEPHIKLLQRIPKPPLLIPILIPIEDKPKKRFNNSTEKGENIPYSRPRHGRQNNLTVNDLQMSRADVEIIENRPRSGKRDKPILPNPVLKSQRNTNPSHQKLLQKI